MGPSGAPPLSDFFPFTVVTRTIYARITGSDVTGDGSVDNPFRTFQRAIAQVAVETGGILANGKRYVVDITGIGIENLPDGYEMPSITGTTFISQFADPSTAPFRLIAPLDIRAYPQPFSAIPVADTSVPASDILSIAGDPATNLVVITTATPRASWAADALKGTFFVGAADANASGAIYGSDATHLFLANVPANVVVQNFSVVEPSATLQGAVASVEGASFNCFNTHSVSFHGIRFRCLDPNPFAAGLAIGGAFQPALELCDVEGMVTNSISEQFFFQANVLRTKAIDIESTNLTISKSLLLSIPSLFFGAARGFLLGRSVADGLGGSIGPSGVFIGGGASGGQRWEITEALVRNTAAGPAFSATASSNWSFITVAINGTAGDAIAVDGPTQAFLSGVTGSGNAGYGVVTSDGAHVQVDATTTIGNVDARAYTNGANPPVPVWPGAPFNDVDLVTLSRVSEP